MKKKKKLQPPGPDERIIDIREPYIFEFGTIPGAENIPLSAIDPIYSLPKDKRICVFCQAGILSVDVAEKLQELGYDAYSMEGGYRWYYRAFVCPPPKKPGAEDEDEEEEEDDEEEEENEDEDEEEGEDA